MKKCLNLYSFNYFFCSDYIPYSVIFRSNCNQFICSLYFFSYRHYFAILYQFVCRPLTHFAYNFVGCNFHVNLFRSLNPKKVLFIYFFSFFKAFAYSLQSKVLHPIAPTANYTHTHTHSTRTLAHTNMCILYVCNRQDIYRKRAVGEGEIATKSLQTRVHALYKLIKSNATFANKFRMNVAYIKCKTPMEIHIHIHTSTHTLSI